MQLDLFLKACPLRLPLKHERLPRPRWLRIFTDVTTYDWRAAMACHCSPLLTFKSDKLLLDTCDSCITQDQRELRRITRVVSSTITATSLIEFNFFSHHFNNNINQNTLLAVVFVSLCCFQQEKTQASNISLYLWIFYCVLWMKFPVYPKNITQRIFSSWYA